jgi:hypothetical protein
MSKYKIFKEWTPLIGECGDYWYVARDEKGKHIIASMEFEKTRRGLLEAVSNHGEPVLLEEIEL